MIPSIRAWTFQLSYPVFTLGQLFNRTYKQNHFKYHLTLFNAFSVLSKTQNLMALKQGVSILHTCCFFTPRYLFIWRLNTASADCNMTLLLCYLSFLKPQVTFSCLMTFFPIFNEYELAFIVMMSEIFVWRSLFIGLLWWSDGHTRTPTKNAYPSSNINKSSKLNAT